jgi:DNA recombination protein RmuC
LDEKSEKFIKMNEEKVGQLLNPLRERLKSFEAKVEQNNKEQVAYGAALKQQIEDIVKTSKQMSEDTLRLTHALKGDKKLQGDWGEMQLEAILNAAGLKEKIHYEAQSSYDNEDGRKQRLDYLIRLPDDKHLILDAKVSLVKNLVSLNGR